MKLRGGFGSAGAGAKSGRSTMTRGGMVKTASERNRRVAALRSAVGDVQTPTVDELRESIRLFRCWWCGRDDIKSLCGHWMKAHGITKAWVIDHLCLPKKTSFICESTRELFSQNGKRQYDPALLRNLGRPRTMSRFGVLSQRKRIADFRAKCGEDFARRVSEGLAVHREYLGEDLFIQQRKAAARKAADKLTKIRTCDICGGNFTMPALRGRHGGEVPRTCGTACDSERRRRIGKEKGAEGMRHAHQGQAAVVQRRLDAIFGGDVAKVWTAEMFAEAAGINVLHTARARLAWLVATGHIRRVARGRYQK